ncbi:MAG: hypothetical protein WBM13_13075 [Bacteroidia bacterium]
MEANKKNDSAAFAKDVRKDMKVLYSGKFKDYELEIHSDLEQTWTLKLPNGDTLYGIHNPFNKHEFSNHVRGFYEGRLAEWLEAIFKNYFGNAESTPAIFTCTQDEIGMFRLTPGPHGFWRLKFPDGTHLSGYGDLYRSAAFSPESVEQFEQQVARRAVEWCRAEFARFYKVQRNEGE